MANGFKIKVDGETVWETDEYVFNVACRTSQGEAADLKVENLHEIDLVTTIRTEFNHPLSLIEEREEENRRHRAVSGSQNASEVEDAEEESDDDVSDDVSDDESDDNELDPDAPLNKDETEHNQGPDLTEEQAENQAGAADTGTVTEESLPETSTDGEPAPADETPADENRSNEDEFTFDTGTDEGTTTETDPGV